MPEGGHFPVQDNIKNQVNLLGAGLIGSVIDGVQKCRAAKRRLYRPTSNSFFPVRIRAFLMALPSQIN